MEMPSVFGKCFWREIFFFFLNEKLCLKEKHSLYQSVFITTLTWGYKIQSMNSIYIFGLLILYRLKADFILWFGIVCIQIVFFSKWTIICNQSLESDDHWQKRQRAQGEESNKAQTRNKQSLEVLLAPLLLWIFLLQSHFECQELLRQCGFYDIISILRWHRQIRLQVSLSPVV